ncbi:YqfO family protein [Bradyrhizobium sp. ARR65]|uniref:Nif3-like dinuclear metal center hexameric protein n=1 Tax=Bradyrhizobium sp. ARR65 TaxID=1040989 RepID=UPI000466014E|nr:YqfO family protein [Bradyrhizobium sp. ARR65]
MRQYKIVVFVPASHGEQVRDAMAQAGAGQIGNYSHCSFTTRGVGRFKPNAGANPSIGEVGKLEEVDEERIETVCTEERLREVLQAIRRAHPYEEPAIDVYPLEVISD